MKDHKYGNVQRRVSLSSALDMLGNDVSSLLSHTGDSDPVNKPETLVIETPFGRGYGVSMSSSRHFVGVLLLVSEGRCPSWLNGRYTHLVDSV